MMGETNNIHDCTHCKHCRDFYSADDWNSGNDPTCKCCVALLKTDDADGKAFLIGVHYEDHCEMFSRREN